MERMPLRFVSLGDSATCGIGDPVPGGHRGWSRILAEALRTGYDVEHWNGAVSGATAATVRAEQLSGALAQQPHLASLVVGVNDVMRSTWDAERMRDDVLHCAAALAGTGALLLTARFHDHGAVFGLPGVIRRPLLARIEQVNRVYDEVRLRHGGIQIDLALDERVRRRDFWSVDRLHPSELGHRALAAAYAERLASCGYSFEPPSLDPAGGCPPTWWRDLTWMAAEGVPWLGRRARDLGPWALRLAVVERAGRDVRLTA